ncbi:UDP-glucosyltransferase 2-like [Choristoneura fumiferana]|uniref:UDP-glucosyltransferase 2-like n=1 Tax=Choristoneura fumiferana TaxID=7141 RepID=UPI003D15B453
MSPNNMISLVVSVTLIFTNLIEAARILAVYPTPSISHQVVFRPLTNELVKRGHEVVVITTDPQYPKGQAPENLTEIDVHDLSYKAWRNTIAVMKNGEKNDVITQAKSFCAVSLKIFEEQTKFPEVQDIIKNKNSTFDLLLVEAWPRFTLGFSHAVKAPVIAVSSLGHIFDNYEVIGAPSHPLLYPQAFNTRLYNLSLWEKFTQLYNMYQIMSFYRGSLHDLEYAAVKRIFGEDTPPFSELQNNVDMLFLNMHPIWEGNFPVPPGVVYMGGLHQNPQKELPKDLKNYLENSKNGVIYISFGTNVDTNVMPQEKVQNIIKAFSELPYDVLWKWNSDELQGKTENIRISKWFPQSDLLRHPKIKLFITQGGLQSTDEALTAGVPLIGIPMLGDQWFNVEKYVHHKIGLQLEMGTLEVESFKNAIETVIGDKSYRENIVRLRTLMNDQPLAPLERTVWWTEHVLRHGGARHLRAPAANMPWAQYYELDLVLLVLSTALAVIVLSSLVIYKLVKFVLSQVSNSKKLKSS